MDYDAAAAKAYIMEKFAAKGDFSFLKEGDLDRMVTEAMRLDAEYMQRSGVNDGGVYDDDAAFEDLFSGVKEAFPQYSMYCMRFVEDFMDFNEEYLDSIGAIDWE